MSVHSTQLPWSVPQACSKSPAASLHPHWQACLNGPNTSQPQKAVMLHASPLPACSIPSHSIPSHLPHHPQSRVLWLSVSPGAQCSVAELARALAGSPLKQYQSQQGCPS
jgi:hypothetical protein